MVNRGTDDGFKGDNGKGRIGNGDQLGSLRKAHPAAVGWDPNNTLLVFGSQIPKEMYNASMAAQKQAELKQGVRESEVKMEVDKTAKSFEQKNSVLVEEGVVRTKSPTMKSTSSENKENKSPDSASRRVKKSPANSKKSPANSKKFPAEPKKSPAESKKSPTESR